MVGRYCRVEPLSRERHSRDLFAAYGADSEARIWTYLPYGPFSSLAEFDSWLREFCLGDDPLFHAIVDRGSGKVLGMASFLRIVPGDGVIEVGHMETCPRKVRGHL